MTKANVSLKTATNGNYHHTRSPVASRPERGAAASTRYRLRLWGIVGLSACLVWSYWPTIMELVAFWRRNQDYSVGMLVPLVAVWLVWRERASLATEPVRPCWWGLVVLALAEAARLGGVFFGYGSGERYALVLCIAGATLLAAGWRIFRRLQWVLIFLVLMIPLPARVHELIALPLQNLATKSAVFGLELLGFFVQREGNILRLESGETVAVAEACSGLRMLTAFVFVAAALAFLVRRPTWHKVVLLAFSIPVAVFSNTLRVIATSIFVNYSGSSPATTAFHDATGLAMMPLAVLLSVALLKFLAFLSPPASPAPLRDPPQSRGRLLRTQDSGLRTSPLHSALSTQHSSLAPRLRLGVAAAAFMLLAGGAGYRAMAAFVGDELAAPIRLDPPLRSLPMVIGDWHGEDRPLAESTLRIAGNDDYVCRAYRNLTTGEALGLYVAYTARPRTMLGHRPSVCYPSAGFTATGVEDLQLNLGDGRALPARIQRFYKAGVPEQRVVVLNYYLLNGVATIDENSFWGLSWRTPNLGRDASRYVAQVQVTVTEQADPSAASRCAQSFALQIAPTIANLLPAPP